MKKKSDNDLAELPGDGVKSGPLSRSAVLLEAASFKVRSIDILGNHTEIQIDHNGEVYRLRKTRLGKLILTK